MRSVSGVGIRRSGGLPSSIPGNPDFSGSPTIQGRTIFNGTAVVLTSQFDKTNATLEDIPGFTANVLAGKTYRFRAVFNVSADAIGGHKYSIAGTATATAVVFQVNSISNATNLFVITSRQSALGASVGQAGAVSPFTVIEGVIVVNAAGTLTVQFAQNTASGTSSVLFASSFTVEYIG